MIRALRRQFNESWSERSYHGLIARLETRTATSIGFPISETPCFFPRSLMDELSATGLELACQILDNPDARKSARAAVPDRFDGPNAEALPTFLQVDFGLVRGRSGAIEPKLVELQAFASLYGFQLAVAEAYRDAFALDPSLGLFLAGLQAAQYHDLVGQALLNGHDPKHVVLMEIEPRRQKTWPDFVVTEDMWGVRGVDTSEIERDGRRLFYQRDGQRTPIARIYNRVIPDELERKNVPLPFDYRDDLEVEWAGHPSWYFQISKFSIPWLKHRSVPETTFLHQLDRLPADRERYLLKPLFSFAGGGIIFAPTDAQVAAIPADQRSNYILQERIQFEPVIETPEGPTQAEIRIMYVRSRDRFQPVLPLIRMGRGQMMGVDHNQGLRWVGASAGLIVDGQ
ncbi:MAG: hypothetical protein Q8O42_14165 [Acidobacteriota bacterium]|nr:hypothetical protein [Acidobacteriota bacterium]